MTLSVGFDESAARQDSTRLWSSNESPFTWTSKHLVAYSSTFLVIRTTLASTIERTRVLLGGTIIPNLNISYTARRIGGVKRSMPKSWPLL